MFALRISRMGLFSRLFKRKPVRLCGPSGLRIVTCYKKDCENYHGVHETAHVPGQIGVIDKNLTLAPCYGCYLNPEEYYKGGADNYRRRPGGAKVLVYTEKGEWITTTEDELEARKPL